MRSAEPIRDKRKIEAMKQYYLSKGQTRNYVLFLFGLHTALRIGDILRLRWSDVYDARRKRMRESFTLTEQKTGKSKTVALHKTVVNALAALRRERGCTDGFVFESRKRKGRAISRIQAYRVIREAAREAALGGVISCHSLRKTFGYHSWRRGVSPAVLMEIYNHSSPTVTRRYLGVTQDDQNKAYLGLQFG